MTARTIRVVECQSDDGSWRPGWVPTAGDLAYLSQVKGARVVPYVPESELERYRSALQAIADGSAWNAGETARFALGITKEGEAIK